jgi:hypothetical protein
MVCGGLEGLVIILDPEKNARCNRKSCQVQSAQSRVKIMVVPTNEERAIALQTLELLGTEGQVRGFAPIGMLEFWNIGIMGSGIMQYCINGPATGGIDDKTKMVNILLKTNIPSFHHSIIPFPGQIQKIQKNSYILSRL